MTTRFNDTLRNDTIESTFTTPTSQAASGTVLGTASGAASKKASGETSGTASTLPRINDTISELTDVWSKTTTSGTTTSGTASSRTSGTAITDDTMTRESPKLAITSRIATTSRSASTKKKKKRANFIYINK